MAKLKLLYDSHGRKNGYADFFCPGCNQMHTVAVDSKIQGANWQFNGNTESPTLSPSVLVKTGHYCKGTLQPPKCANCNSQDSADPWPWPCAICHSFVTDGKIKFLNDCTHALAGQVVELPEIV